MNTFHFMHRCLEKEGKQVVSAEYECLQEKAGKGQLFVGIQEPFNKTRLIDALVLSDSIEGEKRESLSAKLQLLKSGLQDLATDEEVKSFFKFVTAVTVLKAGDKVKVTECKESWKYISAETCYNLFSLYIPTVEGGDDTKEGLLKNVFARMQDSSFGKA